MNLILCGGGSKEQNFVANQKLNEIIDHNKKILYVPLAINEELYSYDDCYMWITKELESVTKAGIDMVKSFSELASKNYFDYAAIYIGSGNTYKLLNGLKEFDVYEKIKYYLENNGIVIGSSAGAIIFGKDINLISVMDSNMISLADTKGFNMLSDISIFPHYTNIKKGLTDIENKKRQEEFTKSIINFSKNVGDVIAIPDEDAIYVSNTIEVIGEKPYYLFKNGILEICDVNNQSIEKQNKIF